MHVFSECVVNLREVSLIFSPDILEHFDLHLRNEQKLRLQDLKWGTVEERGEGEWIVVLKGRQWKWVGYLGGAEEGAKGIIINDEVKKKGIGAEGTIIERKKQEKGFKICLEFRAITGYNKVRPLCELYGARSV